MTNFINNVFILIYTDKPISDGIMEMKLKSVPEAFKKKSDVKTVLFYMFS